MLIVSKSCFRSLLAGLCVLVFQLIGVSQDSLKDGLVVYYPLDGDARDLSGNCFDGLVYGATAAKGVNGVYMKAMSFDGVNDFIEIPNNENINFDIDEDFTLAFWIHVAENQLDLDTIDNDIISKWVVDDTTDDHLNNGYPFAVRIANQKKQHLKKYITAAQFGGYSESCNGNISLSIKDNDLSVFSHVTYVNKRGKLFLYKNGKIAARKGSNVFCSTKNNAPLRIGKRGGKSHQNHFTGAVDNLSIHNRALTEEEISLLAKPSFDIQKLLINKTEKVVHRDTFYFDYNIFELTDAQKSEVIKIHGQLLSSTNSRIDVIGHTNGIPDDDYCDLLSLKRAKVLEEYLYQIGLNCNQVTSIGKGRKDQIASNKTKEDRKKNQRAELILYQSN